MIHENDKLRALKKARRALRPDRTNERADNRRALAYVLATLAVLVLGFYWYAYTEEDCRLRGGRLERTFLGYECTVR